MTFWFGEWLGRQPRSLQVAVFGVLVGVIAYGFVASGAWWLLPAVGVFAWWIARGIQRSSRVP